MICSFGHTFSYNMVFGINIWEELKQTCMRCGIEFEEKNNKFCSNACRDSYIISINNIVQEAVRDDKSHIKVMSFLN